MKRAGEFESGTSQGFRFSLAQAFTPGFTRGTDLVSPVHGASCVALAESPIRACLKAIPKPLNRALGSGGPSNPGVNAWARETDRMHQRPSYLRPDPALRKKVHL